jgi:hypothetical protein
MSVNATLAVLAALGISLAFPRDVAAQEFVYVQNDIIWKQPRSAQSDRVTIVVFNEEQAMFSVSTTLRRTVDTKTVRMNLNAGYLLFCGNWVKHSASEIAVVDYLLEANKYRPNTDDLHKHERTYSLEMSGDALGPLTDTLTDGMRVFRPLPGFQPTAQELKAFWFVCKKSK